MEAFYEEHNYPSVKHFYKLLKENGMKYSMAEVSQFVKNHEVIQLHKPVQEIKKQKRYIVASAPFEIFQIDLIVYKQHEYQNKRFKYLLICVDVFTRYAWGIALKKKDAEATASALRVMFQFPLWIPKAIYTDDGPEWRGEFTKLIDEHKIIHIISDLGDHRILGIIDRFTQTIKRKVAKHMTGKRTTNWIDVIQKLITQYNNTPHTSLGNIKPKDATTPENLIKIGTINYEKQQINNGILQDAKNPIEIGDMVRVERLKGTFAKGYEQTYSPEGHRVVKTHGGRAELENGDSFKFDRLLKVKRQGNAPI